MRRLADRFLHMCVDPAGEDLLEDDFLAICAFSAIGLVLSFRSVLALDELPEMMALL
jgi:hypothetical protein